MTRRPEYSKLIKMIFGPGRKPVARRRSALFPGDHILSDFHMLMKAYDLPCGEAYAFLFCLPVCGKKGILL